MADDEGELENYGTLEGWSERLGIPVETLQARLTGVKETTAQLGDGTLLEWCFYAESDVRRLCGLATGA